MLASLLTDAEVLLTWLVHAAWQAGLLAMVVLALTWLLRTRLQPRWRFALWLIVFARLATPVLPEASWSLFGIVSTAGRPGPDMAADSFSGLASGIADGHVDPRVDNARANRFRTRENRPGSHASARWSAGAKAAAIAPGGATRSLTALAAMIWVAGVVVLVLRRLGSLVHLRRQQRHWQAITDPDVLSVMRQCTTGLRLWRSVSLYTTPDNLGPATCGVVRPCVVVPQRLLDCLSREELRLVLLHELVHVRRWDVLVDQLTGVIAILHWFHPVAWISRYFLRSERELACDAAVLERSATSDAAEYGHVILKTIELLTVPLAPPPGLVGMFGRRPSSVVQRRIRLIVAYRRRGWSGPLVGGMLLAALVLVGLTDAQTKRRPPEGGEKAAASSEKAPPAKTGEAAKPAEEEEQANWAPITVSGRALDAEKRPIAGAEIFLASPRNAAEPLATTKTDDEGTYRFDKVMLPLEGADIAAGRGVGSFEVFGRAAGFGFSWRPLKWFYPHSAGGRTNQVHDPEDDLPDSFGRDDRIALDLSFGPAATLRGRLVDDLGEPLVDAKVAIRRGQPVDDMGGVQNLESFNERSLVPAAVKIRRTDIDGRFEFTELPKNCKFCLDVRPAGHPPRNVWAATVEGVEAETGGEKIDGDDFELVFVRPRKVPLRIVYGDTRQPAVKVGIGGSVNVAGFWETTDDDGAIEVPLPDGEYQLTISPRYGTPYLNTTFTLVVSAETVKLPTTIELRPAAIVDITVVDADTHQPLMGADVWLDEKIAGQTQAYRHAHGYRSWEVETRISHYERPQSDKEGKMHVLFEPGEHRIGVGKDAFPRGYVSAERDGKLIKCQAGAPTAVEFSMRKQPAAGQPGRSARAVPTAEPDDETEKKSAPDAAR